MVNTGKLKAKIVERGLSQRKLSPIVGIGVTTLGKKINGDAEFTLKEVEKMCEILGIYDYNEKCEIFLPRASQIWDDSTRQQEVTQ